MRLLCFLAKHFAWASHDKILAWGDSDQLEGESTDCVVAFIQVESRDHLSPDDQGETCRKAARHLRWLAGKKDLHTWVIHSFAHLGGEPADLEKSREVLIELRRRLEGPGRKVFTTPFGHSCSWEINVFGEGVAKTYKEI